jgi:hypothetical protein
MQIDTLQTYALITPKRYRVEIFQGGERTWEYVSIEIDGIDFAIADPTLHLARIALSFPLSNLYENVDLENYPSP